MPLGHIGALYNHNADVLEHIKDKHQQMAREIKAAERQATHADLIATSSRLDRSASYQTAARHLQHATDCLEQLADARRSGERIPMDSIKMQEIERSFKEVGAFLESKSIPNPALKLGLRYSRVATGPRLVGPVRLAMLRKRITLLGDALATASRR